MIMSEDVQRAVNDETRQLLSDATRKPSGVVASHVRSDVDVANYGLTVAVPRTAKPERDDVRGSGVTEVALVEPRDLPRRHERDGHERIANTLRAQDRERNFSHPTECDRRPNTVARHVHDERHDRLIAT